MMKFVFLLYIVAILFFVESSQKSKKYKIANAKREYGRLPEIWRLFLYLIGKELSKLQYTVVPTRRTFNLIFPGTKWCGVGNISTSYDDLGKYSLTDACCREHDMCPNFIESGKIKYNLFNDGFYTRSHCNCDAKFYNCLAQNSNVSSLSNKIGVIYFNALKSICFKKDYPVIGCDKSMKDGSKVVKCLKYRLDTSANQTYQWFENPVFRGSSSERAQVTNDF